MEGDDVNNTAFIVPVIFLSTPSVWRATRLGWLCGQVPHQDFYPRPPCGGRLAASFDITSPLIISIHALRVEGDAGGLQRYCPECGISIHALRVEGDPLFWWQSTLCHISIHALRVEGDELRQRFLPLEDQHFYPRPPCGGRHNCLCILASHCKFLSTPSVWRATVEAVVAAHRDVVFLSTPSVWRATTT